MHSPLSKKNSKFIKRFTMFRNDLDSEIEVFYNQILQKIKNGYEKDELIPDTEQVFNYLHYMMIKPIKTTIEINIIKLYLYKMKKFMSIFTNVNLSIEELMTKIVAQLKLEEIEADRVICKQGDRGDKFYLILKGTISVIIQKEYTVRMSKTDYLQFLIHLHLYQENELINRIILLNKNVYFIEEKDLSMLFTVFRVFKYFIDTNPHKYTTKYVADFLEGEHDIYLLIRDKFDCSPERCVRILGLDDLGLRSAFLFYESQYEKMMSECSLIKKTTTAKGKLGRGSLISVKPTIEEIYTNIINTNAISSEYIYLASKDNYCERLQPPAVSNLIVDSEVKIFKYVEVVALNDGNIFGDVALQNSSKKRTATIITKTNCFFGTLTKSAYDLCLKSTQDRLRYMKILYFLNGPIFKNVNQNIFESKYFNWFKQIELNKNTVIFTKNSPMKNIFFIRHGELELSVKMSFEELNDIIKGLGGKVNEEKEKKLACDSIEFHKFYYMKKHTFRFCLLKDNEIAGLEDFVIDGKYFCDCTVASGKISIFELEENFYQNLVAEKQIKKNVDEYVTLKKTVLCQRLLSVRETKLVNEKSKINIENKEFLNTIKKQQRKNKKEKLVAPLIVEALRNKERMFFTPISPTKLSLNNFQKCKKISSTASTIKQQCQSIENDVGENRKLQIPNIKSFTLSSPTMDVSSRGMSSSTTNIRLNKTKVNATTLGFSTAKKKRGHSVSDATFLKTQPNTTIKSMRVRKVFLSTSCKFNKPLKEIKFKYFDNRTFSPNEKDNFYYNHLHVLSSVVSPKKGKTRNKGFIDFLVLDKWAEAKYKTEYPQ